MSLFKKYFTYYHILLLVVLVFFAYTRGPGMIKNWKLKGQPSIPLYNVKDITDHPIDVEGSAYAIVFWATWCKPCNLELARINSLVEASKIKAQKVIAVSLDNEKNLVVNAAAERGYKFPVVWDQTGELSRRYQVEGTPTTIVVNKDHKIVSAATGVSPLLEMRLKKYLR